MRILQVHCYYQQPGGEDGVVEAEQTMLRRHGHEVKLLSKHNDIIPTLSAFGKLRVAVGTSWSMQSYQTMLTEIQSFKPDIVHVHNAFPLWSPSIFDACTKSHVPVIQTIHNFRYLCSNALFYRDGKTCETCISKSVPYAGVVHACYRDSRAQSAVLALATAVNNTRGLKKQLQVIALSQFAKQKLVQGGFPPEHVHVKPNFLQQSYETGSHQGGFALFVGRLSEEKGIRTLAKALQILDGKVPVKIAGDGPMRTFLESLNLKNVDILGRVPRDSVINLMKDARCLLFTSEWYENCPLTLLEALAVGLPVIASNLGSIGEFIEDKKHGWLVPARNPQAFAGTVLEAFAESTNITAVSEASIATYNAKYNIDANYQQLLQIYQSISKR